MTQDNHDPASGATTDKQDVMTEPRPPAQGRKGDGCRTDLQRTAYPYGRTRLTQIFGRTNREKEILEWLIGHKRTDRHAAIWMLLEAGFTKLFGKNAPPPPTDCGSRLKKSAKAKTAWKQAAAADAGRSPTLTSRKRAPPSA